MLPVFTALATELATIDTLSMVQLDGSANDLSFDDVEIAGFPAVFLFPAKDKSAVTEFEGDSTVSDLLLFLQQFATHPFEFNQALIQADENDMEDYFDPFGTSDEL
jgi:hypothetical protein